MANHLTDEQKNKAAVHLQKIKGCPACDGKRLSIEDMVVVNPLWDGTIHAGTESIALLQVACSGCFHVMHFSASALGLS